MKLFLVLCLVAPLAVFGGVVSFDSTNEIYGWDDLPTENQMNCLHNVIQTLEEKNPDLVWWFEKLHESTIRINKKIDECRKTEKKDDKKKCMDTMKILILSEMEMLHVILPAEKKQVYTMLSVGVKECMKTY